MGDKENFSPKREMLLKKENQEPEEFHFLQEKCKAFGWEIASMFLKWLPFTVVDAIYFELHVVGQKAHQEAHLNCMFLIIFIISYIFFFNLAMQLDRVSLLCKIKFKLKYAKLLHSLFMRLEARQEEAQH